MMITEAALATLPTRMKKLPIDPRYNAPVPWFVDWVNDQLEPVEPNTPGARPEFRAMDRRKFIRALRDRLCWVCGEPLGRHLAFVAGPMCAATRTTSEPPNHYDCARWSVEHCPFLANPQMTRRSDDLPPEIQEPAGYGLERNPGVAMLWITRSFEKFRDDKGMYLLTMGEPERVEWYCEGRPASRHEVQHSIDTGLPNLMHLARQDGPFAVEQLGKQVQMLDRWLPVADLQRTEVQLKAKLPHST